MSTYCHCDWLLLRHFLLVTMVQLTVKILKATANKYLYGIITPFLKANDKELHFKKKRNVFFKRFKLSVEKIMWHLFSLRLSELLSPHPPYLSLSREKLTTCRASQSPQPLIGARSGGVCRSSAAERISQFTLLSHREIPVKKPLIKGGSALNNTWTGIVFHT